MFGGSSQDRKDIGDMNTNTFLDSVSYAQIATALLVIAYFVLYLVYRKDKPRKHHQ